MSTDTGYTRKSNSKLLWWIMGILAAVFTVVLSGYLKSITNSIEENHKLSHSIEATLSVKGEHIASIEAGQVSIDRQLSEIKSEQKAQDVKLDLILRRVQH